LGQAPEKMRHHLGGELSRERAVELSLEHEIGPPTEIERAPRLGFVHGEHEPVTLAAPLVAQGLAYRRAERERRILDRVMVVDVQVALDRELELKSAVPGDLIEHVIEK